MVGVLIPALGSSGNLVGPFGTDVLVGAGVLVGCPGAVFVVGASGTGVLVGPLGPPIGGVDGTGDPLAGGVGPDLIGVAVGILGVIDGTGVFVGPPGVTLMLGTGVFVGPPGVGVSVGTFWHVTGISLTHASSPSFFGTSSSRQRAGNDAWSTSLNVYELPAGSGITRIILP